MSLRHLFPEKTLDEKYPTIAEALAHDGYRTGAFSANPSDIDDAVLKWMIRDRSRPFFAFLNYFDVHVPYRPPLSYSRRFGDPDPVGMFHGDDYDDCIVYIDDYIGRLMKEVRAQGLAGC
jgi:arylsulfatase A-like enzyme